MGKIGNVLHKFNSVICNQIVVIFVYQELDWYGRVEQWWLVTFRLRDIQVKVAGSSPVLIV